MTARIRVTKNNLPKVIWVTEFQGKAVGKNVAEDMMENAKYFAPVRFGFLRNGIEMNGSGGEWTVSSQSTRGGADRDYAAYVEWGTSKTPAQPYMAPAFRKGSTVDLRVAAREFGNDLRRAAR